MNLISNMEAKNFFQATGARYTKARAIVETAKRFNVTKAEVKRCAVYWW